MRALVAVAGVIAALALVAWTWSIPASPRAQPGWQLYDRLCVACHGADGDGRGPAAPYTWGRPRAFTSGEYKWRSTPIGEPPTDDDLRTTIRFGAPGTSMHAFALTDAELAQLVAVVKSFAPARPATTAITLAPPTGTHDGAALWTKHGCASCHGADGRGNPLLAPRPYDLTRSEVRRPRPRDDRDARRQAIAMSIATGLSGTAMPAYSALSSGEIFALADHVLAFGGRARGDRSALDVEQIEADRSARIVAGTWPGTGPEAVVFGAPVAPQGPPPASLAPAQASLSVRQCARCHAKQASEWTGTIHSLAVGPGLLGQIDHALPAAESASCRRCHAPLAEQATDLALRAEGIQCAGCHVRQWTRHGPPDVSASLAPVPNYPLQTLELYERGDFCMTCHQLPPRSAVNGKPLLNTYKEWLEGPYMKRGVQCQHCHMPNREHTWKGIHERDTFRQGYELLASAVRKADKATISADITNVGAGHYLPTTPTPAVLVTLELLDARGAPIPNAASTYVIKRGIRFDGVWHETSDTRIPPGETRSIARAWSHVSSATHARITIAVHPDAFYEQIYTQRLAGKLNAAQVALYKQALATAIARRYVAETRTLPLRSE